MTFAAIEGARLKTPSTWDVVPFKRIATLREDPDTSASAALLSLKNTGVLVTRGDDVQPPSAEHRLRYWRTDPGDLVVNPMWLAGGAIGVSTVFGAVSPDYRVYSMSSRVEPRFIHHLFRSAPYHDQYRLLMRAETTFDRRVTKEDFADLPVVFPPLKEQRKIADFLDSTTTRIDALIAKKRTMIERLNERLSADVYFAVARGLSEDVEFAPVHVSWIGEMPRHWGLPALGANYHVQLGKMLNPAASEGPTRFPYLRNVNVQWDRLGLTDLKEMHFDEDEQQRLKLLPGDLLVCEGGEVGRAAIWRGELETCFFQKAVHRIRPLRAGNTRFLMYCLRAAAKRGVFKIEGNQSTIVHLTAEQLRVHRFPWPPLAEQNAIVRYLDRRTAERNKPVERLELQISLLREHRQALITAAVIGELEVAKAAV